MNNHFKYINIKKTHTHTHTPPEDPPVMDHGEQISLSDGRQHCHQSST